MEKINVAELLKYCPKGMELDCTIFEGVVFHDVVDRQFPIRVRREQGGLIELTANGCIKDKIDAKCVIFPKGRTTWEGFQIPFKDGDIVATDLGSVFILKSCLEDKIHYHSYIGVTCCNEIQEKQIPFAYKHVCHLATEEEKQKLFQAIKERGYKWNAETKTLEKLIQPKFKVGDRIKHIVGREEIATVISVEESHYNLDSKVGSSSFSISLQREWGLVPNKFDINTLKPFDKVLVRGGAGQKWIHDFFGFMDKDKAFPFVCVGHYVIQCIPYEGNEHLLGKTADCDEFYKTWEQRKT